MHFENTKSLLAQNFILKSKVRFVGVPPCPHKKVLILVLLVPMRKYSITNLELEYAYSYSHKFVCTVTCTHEKLLNYIQL